MRSVSDNASVTCGVKLNVPATDGRPEITPVSGSSVTSVGSAPESMLHFECPSAPDGLQRSAVGCESVSNSVGEQACRRGCDIRWNGHVDDGDRQSLSICLEKSSVTCTVKLAVPVPVGVPEMTPAGLRERLDGSDQRSGSTRAFLPLR